MNNEQKAEHDALADLLKSDGWQIFVRLVHEQYSPARCLDEIDATVEQLRPGDDERAVITQIRAAWKVPPVVLGLPGERLRQLKGGKVPTPLDVFKAFRRVPR